MELGGKPLNSLRIKTQFLKRLQGVSVVDGAAHTQKDDVESNGGSLENVAEIFVLFFCGVQLVLRSVVLIVHVLHTQPSSRTLLTDGLPCKPQKYGSTLVRSRLLAKPAPLLILIGSTFMWWWSKTT